MSPWRVNEVYLNSKGTQNPFCSSSIVKKKHHQQVCVGKRLQRGKCLSSCSPLNTKHYNHHPTIPKTRCLRYCKLSGKHIKPTWVACSVFHALRVSVDLCLLISDIKTVPLPFVTHILAFTWLIELIYYFAVFKCVPKKKNACRLGLNRNYPVEHS